MKYYYCLLIGLIALISGSVYSQQLVRNKLLFAENAMLKNFDEGETINGSPYSSKDFIPAKIYPLDEIFNVRYNAYTDEMEVKLEEEKVLVLDKTVTEYVIKVLNPDKTYVILSIPQDNYGYFIFLKEFSNLTLYKKETKSFHEKKEAKSSYQQGSPAYYSDSEYKYFLKKNDSNELMEFSNNKSSLYKLFPNKKDKIKTYLKKNKVDLDTDAGIEKVVGFLNQSL